MVTQVQPNKNYIQHVSVAKGYLFAIYKGGSAATNNKGVSWVRGTHNHHLPSFSDFNSFVSTKSRIFVSTPNNNIMSNSLGEIPALDTSIFISKKTISFLGSSDTDYFSISTNVSWTASVSDSWISIDETEGLWTGHIEVKVTPSELTREGYVVIMAENKKDTVFINQNKVTSNIDVAFGEFNVFPNPNKGSFTVVMNANEPVQNLSLMSLEGRTIEEVKNISNNSYRFDGNLRPGIYLLQISNARGNKVRRVTVVD